MTKLVKWLRTIIESLRTTQIAFLIRNAFFVSGRAEERYKKYSCKGACEGKSYEATSFSVPDLRVFPPPGDRFSAQTTENGIYNWAALKGAAQW